MGAVSCPRQKERSTEGAPSAGRRVRSRKPSRWSHRRSTQPELVHVHTCCRLQPERLKPDPPTQGEALCPAGRRIMPREPSRWSGSRTSIGCGLRDSGQILQLKVKRSVLFKSLRVVLLDYGENVRQVSMRDNSTGATMAWPNSNNASLSVLCSSSSDDESVQQAHIAREAKS